MESKLPHFHEFVEFVEGARLPSNDGDCQLPCRVDATSIVTSTNRYIAPTVPRPAQKVPTRSPLEHSSVRKASGFEESECSDTRRRDLCQWQGRLHGLLSSKDRAAHEVLHNNDQSSSNGPLLASGNNKRPRPSEAPEDNFLIGEKRQRVPRHDVPSTVGSNSTKTGSSASSKTLRAKPSVRCTPPRRPTLETDNSDMDLVVQHKVEEGKVAHKRAEQKRRNEQSSLITEMEHRLPSEFLDGCQPRNQKPGYSKNGTLKAMLNCHKHQATLIEDQDKIIEAQAAANAALKERYTALMQQCQQCGSWNELPG